MAQRWARVIGVAMTIGCAREMTGAAVSTNPTLITSAEIRRTGASNVYDALLQLRPAFLATRGAISFRNEPPLQFAVVIDRRVIGGLEELRAMEVTDVASVRRLTVAEVFQLTGVAVSAGGVEVKRGR